MTFDDTSFTGPQLLAMQGEERTHLEFGPGGFCSKNGAGAALICVASDVDSAWNNVQSDTVSWESFSSMTPLAPTLGSQYYETGFTPIDPWLAPSPTNTGFRCDNCDTVATAESRAYSKMWGAQCNSHSYFRKPVPMSCVRSTCLLYTSPSPRDRG